MWALVTFLLAAACAASGAPPRGDAAARVADLTAELVTLLAPGAEHRRRRLAELTPLFAARRRALDALLRSGRRDALGAALDASAALAAARDAALDAGATDVEDAVAAHSALVEERLDALVNVHVVGGPAQPPPTADPAAPPQHNISRHVHYVAAELVAQHAGVRRRHKGRPGILRHATPPPRRGGGSSGHAGAHGSAAHDDDSGSALPSWFTTAPGTGAPLLPLRLPRELVHRALSLRHVPLGGFLLDGALWADPGHQPVWCTSPPAGGGRARRRHSCVAGNASVDVDDPADAAATVHGAYRAGVASALAHLRAPPAASADDGSVRAGGGRQLRITTSRSTGARRIFLARLKWYYMADTDSGITSQASARALAGQIAEFWGRQSDYHMLPFMENVSHCVYNTTMDANTAGLSQAFTDLVASAAVHPDPTCRFAITTSSTVGAGPNGTSYQHVFLMHPGANVGYAGVAYVPGTTSAYNGGYANLWVSGHEAGHNWGLLHGWIQNPLTITNVEYGDNTEVMASARSSWGGLAYQAGEKHALGWMDPVDVWEAAPLAAARTRTLLLTGVERANHTLTLGPGSTPASDAAGTPGAYAGLPVYQTARLPLLDGVSSGSPSAPSNWVYLSWRPAYNGAVLRGPTLNTVPFDYDMLNVEPAAQGSGILAPPVLLDAVPWTEDQGDADVEPGDAYVLPSGMYGGAVRALLETTSGRLRVPATSASTADDLITVRHTWLAGNGERPEGRGCGPAGGCQPAPPFGPRDVPPARCGGTVSATLTSVAQVAVWRLSADDPGNDPAGTGATAVVAHSCGGGPPFPRTAPGSVVGAYSRFPYAQVVAGAAITSGSDVVTSLARYVNNGTAIAAQPCGEVLFPLRSGQPVYLAVAAAPGAVDWAASPLASVPVTLTLSCRPSQPWGGRHINFRGTIMEQRPSAELVNGRRSYQRHSTGFLDSSVVYHDGTSGWRSGGYDFNARPTLGYSSGFYTAATSLEATDAIGSVTPACPANMYEPQLTPGTCAACPPYSQAVVGESAWDALGACDTCVRGSFWDAVARACTPCPAGTYRGSTSVAAVGAVSTACTPCPAAKPWARPGATSSLACTGTPCGRVVVSGHPDPRVNGAFTRGAATGSAAWGGQPVYTRDTSADVGTPADGNATVARWILWSTAARGWLFTAAANYTAATAAAAAGGGLAPLAVVGNPLPPEHWVDADWPDADAPGSVTCACGPGAALNVATGGCLAVGATVPGCAEGWALPAAGGGNGTCARCPAYQVAGPGGVGCVCPPRYVVNASASAASNSYCVPPPAVWVGVAVGSLTGSSVLPAVLAMVAGPYALAGARNVSGVLAPVYQALPPADGSPAPPVFFVPHPDRREWSFAPDASGAFSPRYGYVGDWTGGDATALAGFSGVTLPLGGPVSARLWTAGDLAFDGVVPLAIEPLAAVPVAASAVRLTAPAVGATAACNASYDSGSNATAPALAPRVNLAAALAEVLIADADGRNVAWALAGGSAAAVPAGGDASAGAVAPVPLPQLLDISAPNPWAGGDGSLSNATAAALAPSGGGVLLVTLATPAYVASVTVVTRRDAACVAVDACGAADANGTLADCGLRVGGLTAEALAADGSGSVVAAAALPANASRAVTQLALLPVGASSSPALPSQLWGAATPVFLPPEALSAATRPGPARYLRLTAPVNGSLCVREVAALTAAGANAAVGKPIATSAPPVGGGGGSQGAPSAAVDGAVGDYADTDSAGWYASPTSAAAGDTALTVDLGGGGSATGFDVRRVLVWGCAYDPALAPAANAARMRGGTVALLSATGSTLASAALSGDPLQSVSFVAPTPSPTATPLATASRTATPSAAPAAQVRLRLPAGTTGCLNLLEVTVLSPDGANLAWVGSGFSNLTASPEATGAGAPFPVSRLGDLVATDPYAPAPFLYASATQAGAGVNVSFAAPALVAQVLLVNRRDATCASTGCGTGTSDCGARLNGLVVETVSPAGAVLASRTVSTTRTVATLDFGLPVSPWLPAGADVGAADPTGVAVRYIRVLGANNTYLHLKELQAWAAVGDRLYNAALWKRVTTDGSSFTGDAQRYLPSMLVDGQIDLDATSGGSMYHSGLATAPGSVWVQVDLGAPTRLVAVTLYNRNGLLSRLTNATLQLLSGSGSLLWAVNLTAAPILTFDLTAIAGGAALPSPAGTPSPTRAPSGTPTATATGTGSVTPGFGRAASAGLRVRLPTTSGCLHLLQVLAWDAYGRNVAWEGAGATAVAATGSAAGLPVSRVADLLMRDPFTSPDLYMYSSPASPPAGSPPAAVNVSFAAPAVIAQVLLVTRRDTACSSTASSCGSGSSDCGARLGGALVDLLAPNGSVLSTRTVATGAATVTTLSTGVPWLAYQPPAAAAAPLDGNAVWTVQVVGAAGTYLHFRELHAVEAGTGANLALRKAAACSGTFAASGYGPELAVDGAIAYDGTTGDLYHSNASVVAGDTRWWVPLGGGFTLSHVVIWNRRDSGLNTRLAGATLQLLNGAGRVLWSTALPGDPIVTVEVPPLASGSTTASPSPSMSPGTRSATLTPSRPPSATASRSATPSVTPSLSATATATPTLSATTTATPSITPTHSGTGSLSATATGSPSQVLSLTPSGTGSSTGSGSGTPSRTGSDTGSLSGTPSGTGSPSQTPSGTGSGSYTASLTASLTNTPSPTGSTSQTPSGTGSGSTTASGTAASTGTATGTPTLTQSPPPSTSGTPTGTQSGTPRATATGTGTPSPTRTGSPTGSRTGSGTGTATPSGTRTPPVTPSGTSTGTGTGSRTRTGTVTPTGSPTGSRTGTPPPTGTPSPTGTPPVTGTPTQSGTPSGTGTPSASGSGTGSPSSTGTGSASGTGSRTGSGSSTGTPPPTRTPSQTGTGSASGTGTGSASATPSGSETGTPAPTASRTAPPSGSGTPSHSRTARVTGTKTPLPTRTPSPVGTPSRSASVRGTASPSRTRTRSRTRSRTASATRKAKRA